MTPPARLRGSVLIIHCLKHPWWTIPERVLLLLNAMSANTGMRWSIAETEAALGVRAVDNSLPNHA